MILAGVGGCSLTWGMILAIGILTSLLMGVFNPYITREEKAKIKELKSNCEIKVTIKFRFKKKLYFIVAICFSVLTVLVENFERILDARTLIGVLAVVGRILLQIILFFVFLVVFAVLAENRSTNAMRSWCENRGVVVDE